MVKAKWYYKNALISKCIKKISLVKELYFDVSNENKLFYYNSLGILSLKSKNYSRAELLFKLGLETAKKMNNPITKNKKDAMIPRSNFICYLQFNLALSFFFQRKYKESNILKRSFLPILVC
mgnify:FL=1